MRTIAIVTVTWLALVSSRQAVAIPSVVYSPATGNILITNDTGAVLPALLLKSGAPGLGELATGDRLTGVPLDLGNGSILDKGDQPSAITYLNFPIGGPFNIGNVVTPGTPFSNLSLEYYEGSLTTPVKPGVFLLIPEPATATSACLALTCLALRRRQAPPAPEPPTWA